MFSLLYKLNNIKSQNKTKIIFIIGSITYILIHYILFNDVFDRLQIKYIQYPRYLIYIVFAIDLIYYNNSLNKEKIKKLENDIKQNENYDIDNKLNNIIQQYQQPILINQPKLNNQNFNNISKPIQILETKQETNKQQIPEINIKMNENNDKSIFLSSPIASLHENNKENNQINKSAIDEIKKSDVINPSVSLNQTFAIEAQKQQDIINNKELEKQKQENIKF